MEPRLDLRGGMLERGPGSFPGYLPPHQPYQQYNHVVHPHHHHQQQLPYHPLPDHGQAFPHLQPYSLPYLHQEQQQLHPNTKPYLHQELQQQQLHPPVKSRNESKFLMTRKGPVGSAGQSTAAASFYAKRQQKSNFQQLPKPVSNRFGTNSSEEEEKLKTNFRSIIVRAPPAMPSGLLARIEGGEDAGVGKVRVIVRIASKRPLDEERTRFFNVDKKKRQVTLLDPTVGRGEIPIEERKVGVAAPKMFAYDGIYLNDDSQEEVATACLIDVISAVINGNDGCLFCFGHSNLGKSYTMLGEDTCKNSVGVIPTAIAWLYRAIKERKQKTSARFSVRVSAVEISQGEQLHDLLSSYASETDQSPGVYLRQLPASQSCVLQNLSEVRASSVDKAAYYLDAALSSRSTDPQGRESHFLYTIHVYQYSVDKTGKGGVAGGRSRLHLIDFGGCERSQSTGNGITLSGLGNVILGIFNGQKHLPCRNSKVTGILKECLGSLTCHATMVAHVSPEPSHYSETLHTLQLASRIHRMRRKRLKTGSSRGSTSSDEGRRLGRLKSHDGRSGSSDFTTSTDPSSSEMSCNTVVYRGQSDGSGTDGEAPPTSAGGFHKLKRRNLSGSRILTNGAISPRLSASPQPTTSQVSPSSSQYLLGSSPARLTPTLPAIRESQGSSPHGKMPLNGKVPGYRQPAEIWIDGDRERQKNAAPTTTAFPKTTEQRRYGFMDEFKANMISHWVENQKSREPESGSLYLTQFKQADSDSGSEKFPLETQAEVHPQQNKAAEKRRVGPPPPPRRSSSMERELHSDQICIADQRNNSTKDSFLPRSCSNNESFVRSSETNLLDGRFVRDDLQVRRWEAPAPDDLPVKRWEAPAPEDLHLSPRGETEGSDSSGPLPEPNFDQLFPASITGNGKSEKLDFSPSSDHLKFDLQLLPPPASNPGYSSLPRPGRPEDGPINTDQEHPLRILSEENLTVVSTFVADIKDLEDDLEDDCCSVSKLSFFEVPDYTGLEENLQISDEKYFENRLKELTKMTERKRAEQSEVATAPTEAEVSSPYQLESVTDPRFKSTETKDILSTFTQSEQCKSRDQQSSDPGSGSKEEEEEPMTPQKQFLLLSQTVRRPDGSSNPDIDMVPLPAKRSPGSGQSSSDHEEEDEANDVDAKETRENPPPPEPEQHGGGATKKDAGKKREMSNIALMLFRIFGSSRKKNSKKSEDKRSKSCDRELDGGAPAPAIYKNIKSASSSPLKRTDRRSKAKTDKASEKDCQPVETVADASRLTPSTLSLATEWEFQTREDEINGNNQQQQQRQQLDLQQQQQRQQLDFQQQLQRHQFDLQQSFFHPEFTYTYSSVLQRQERKSSGYDSLDGENSSLDSGNGNPSDRMFGGQPVPEYSVPQTYADMDDIALLKLEIGRHPDILNKNY